MGQNVLSNGCYSSPTALAAGVGCPSTVGLKPEPQLLSIYVSTCQDLALEKNHGQQIILVCTKKKAPWLIPLGHRATVLLQCLEERLLLNLSLLRAQEGDDHTPPEQKGASRENGACSPCLNSVPCTVCNGSAARARCGEHSSS